MKIALYARSSINSQKHSINMQKGLALEKAKAHGVFFDNSNIYLDEAVSARLTGIHERPQLQLLINEIMNNNISTLYVYKRDRLARTVLQYMEIYEMLRDKEVHVVFTSENEIPIQYSPAGEFFELMMAGFNQREANQIVQRIKETKYTMTKQGKHAQGRIPYGYKLDDDKKYVPKPNQAVIVSNIYHALVDTDCVTFSIFVSDLQSKSWFPLGWDYNRVHSMIENTIYKGIRKIEEFGEMVEIENENMLIVDEFIWNKAQERLSSLKITREKTSTRIHMMLDGLLFCGKCNSEMFGKAKKDSLASTYYTCKSHSYHKISPTILEEAILEKCVEFAKEQFKTHFLEVYQKTDRNMYKFFRSSINESATDLIKFKQALSNETDLWLESPTMERQVSLIYLYNCILREELLQEHYQKDIEQLEKQFALLQGLQDSADLMSEVFSLNCEEREQFIKDIVGKITLTARLVEIQFKTPLLGKAMIADFTAS